MNSDFNVSTLDDLQKEYQQTEYQYHSAFVKSKKLHKFCSAVAVTTIITSFLVLISSVLPANKQVKIIEESGYSEFNEDYIQKQKDIVAEKVYSKEIAIEDYDAEIEKIADYPRDKFAEEHLSSEDMKKYQSCEKSQKAIIASSLGALGLGFASVISGMLTYSYYDRKKNTLDKKMTNLYSQIYNINRKNNLDTEKKAETDISFANEAE